MRIAAVITSVNYGDFLAATLPGNRAVFDYIVVATTPEDTRTQKVCEFWNVHCIRVPEFHTPDGGFRKGAGINAAIAELKAQGKADGWVIHMDADVMAPPLAGEMLRRAKLDPAMVYGCDRMMVRSFEDWWDFISFPKQGQHECGAYIHPKPFDIGVRIYSRGAGYDGYVPIGFFQMWSPSGSGVWAYPAEHTDAGRGDMLFTRNWPRDRRAMIPELIVYHLESAKGGAMGVNWRGRKTPLFAPARHKHAVPRPYDDRGDAPALVPFLRPDEALAFEQLLLAHAPSGRHATVLEWGSGGSTHAFAGLLRGAGRRASWTAVEHDGDWAARVSHDAPDGVHVVHAPFDVDDEATWGGYVAPVELANRTFDVIIVDGRLRRRCLEHVAREGLLRDDDSVVILHDAEREYYKPAFVLFEGGRYLGERVWVAHRKHARRHPDPAPCPPSPPPSPPPEPCPAPYVEPCPRTCRIPIVVHGGCDSLADVLYFNAHVRRDGVCAPPQHVRSEEATFAVEIGDERVVEVAFSAVTRRGGCTTPDFSLGFKYFGRGHAAVP